MPKLYDYFGLIIMFHVNEHDPVHVHGKTQGRESRAEIVVINGKVSEIRYSPVVGRLPLESNEMRYFEELVTVKAEDIVSKWIDFFVLHKPVKPVRITEVLIKSVLSFPRRREPSQIKALDARLRGHDELISVSLRGG